MEHGRQASSGPRSPSPRRTRRPRRGPGAAAGGPVADDGIPARACPLLRRPDHRRYQV